MCNNTVDTNILHYSLLVTITRLSKASRHPANSIGGPQRLSKSCRRSATAIESARYRCLDIGIIISNVGVRMLGIQ